MYEVNESLHPDLKSVYIKKPHPTFTSRVRKEMFIKILKTDAKVRIYFETTKYFGDFNILKHLA